MQLSSRNIFSQKLAFFSDENRLMTAKANGLNIQSRSDRVYSHHSATQMLVTLLFLNEFSQFKVRRKLRWSAIKIWSSLSYVKAQNSWKSVNPQILITALIY